MGWVDEEDSPQRPEGHKGKKKSMIIEGVGILM
jgi:hypothetical protein